MTPTPDTPYRSSRPSAGRPPGGRLKARSARDLLAAVPFILGFEPKDSLVLMSLSGRLTGATLRMDLPPAAFVEPVGFARHGAALLRSDGTADGALVLVYTNEPWTDPARLPRKDLVEAFCEALADQGLPVRDSWLVGAEHWRCYSCQGPRCCLGPGHPLSEVRDSAVAAELVYRGNSYASSAEAATGTDLPAAWEDRERVLETWRAAAVAGPDSWREEGSFTAALGLWDSFLDDPDAVAALRRDPAGAGILLAGLECKVVRDSVLVLASLNLAVAVGGPILGGYVHPAMPHEILDDEVLDDEVLDDEVLEDEGWEGEGWDDDGWDDEPGPYDPDFDPLDALGDFPDYVGLYSAVLVGESRERPDWERLDRLHEILRNLLVVAEEVPRSAVLTMLGWIEWMRGRNSVACTYLEQCLADAPEYTLARLLHQLMGSGVLGVWARSRELAWTGGGGGTPQTAA